MGGRFIEVERLGKQYESAAPGTPPALQDVSVAIEPGEFVAVMGPSGSGKSTFMNIVGLLDTPTGGAYRLNGHDVAGLATDELAHLRNRVFGFVFQGFNLLKRITVLENVALPMVYSGTPGAIRRARGQELLERVGLGPYAGAMPNRLSGGQQQRVAIARALANHPQLILADEPTGNLDTQTSMEIMGLFTTLNRETGVTILLVTHENDIAAYANRLIRFKDGRVVHDGPVVHEDAA
jgi:putative ABC transport system ATP-binding protein